MKKFAILIIMMFIGLTGYSLDKGRTISGTVYDSHDQKPMPGVTVVVKGTPTVVSTDANGKYAITVPNNNAVLRFTFVGYISQEINTGKKDTLNVYLKASSSALNEVVVIGYGVQKKQSVTGSVAVVNAAPMADKAIRGRVAGLPVGTPGAATTAMYKNVGPTTYGYAMPPIAQGTESYAEIAENKFYNPKETPLSTFSVDVDAASYSNVRRFIQGGQLPPKDAIRIEEMINYFKYKYDEPKAGEPVNIQTDLAAAPWNPKHRLLRIGLKARTIPTDKLPASNLVFLIDVSGSMYADNKLPLVKTSMKMLVDQLRKQDRVAIVVYAGNAGLVLPSTPGDEKTKINDAIDNLQAGGSTAGGAGIMLAYKVARENFMKGGNNRVVLATDGDFNVGASSDKSMEELITQERESKIDLSIMGFGMGNYKDSKMETLADKGNGNYAYIDNLTEAHKALVSEFGGTMFTVAKDVKLQIEFNPAKVQAYRLIGYENRVMAKEDFNNDKKDAGDMGSGHTVTAFYEIVPAGIKDDYAGSVDPLKYQKNDAKPVVTSGSEELVTVKFRYKQPGGDVSKLSQAVVLDKPEAFDKLSADFRFAAAVAEVGMLLRNSEFKGKASFEQAISIARASRGDDAEGYRGEFVRLAESARSMVKSAASAQVNNSEDGR